MNADQREFSRAPLTGWVRFFDWDVAQSAEPLEISGNGVFLKTADVRRPGSMLTLRVALPGLRDAFTVLGKVVRVVQQGPLAPSGMGIRFIDLKPKDREMILTYVSQRILKKAA